MLRLHNRLGAPEPGSEEPEINMAPLIDMVFILLIFFLVTTSFVRESGIKVNRPQAASAQTLEQGALMVGLDAAGGIHLEGRQVSLHGVRGLVERYLAENPQGSVIVAGDRQLPTGRLIAVVDQCRLAGARDVAVAAQAESR
ncbi:MAG: biopolymer transporter ExbD [Deltaproteobacteria bacterium]|nr:biopolymer transporter ExbD [Deltaproteobacteria bacterium]